MDAVVDEAVDATVRLLRSRMTQCADWQPILPCAANLPCVRGVQIAMRDRRSRTIIDKVSL